MGMDIGETWHWKLKNVPVAFCGVNNNHFYCYRYPADEGVGIS